MKRLILMRHAKSSWDNLDLSDHDRTLNARGRADCELLAAWMAERKLSPTQVLCSTAERCVETCAAILKDSDAEVSYKRSLYHASEDQILAQVQGLTDDCVMVFAHNPGTGYFASRILAKRPEHPKFCTYPTAAITVVDFDIDDWAKLDFKTGTLDVFITPSDLKS